MGTARNDTNHTPYSYVRYLESKQKIDDRALNQPVLDTLRREFARNQRSAEFRVLELGGGTGSMIRRVLDWSILPHAHYTLVDDHQESLADIPNALAQWARQRVHPTECIRNTNNLVIRSPQEELQITLELADVTDYLSSCDHSFDLIIANAFLDLVDVSPLLKLLWQVCSSDALFWFTINFDGESCFLPTLSDDGTIFSAYHESMNHRPGSGKTGRQLFTELGKHDAQILAAGSSDWVVFPTEQGYRDDDAYFLHHIVHTIDTELRGSAAVHLCDFEGWIKNRHQQIDTGELVYIAHQLDFTGRVPRRQQQRQ